MSRSAVTTPIVASHVTQRFGAFVAVDDVDLAVERGEVVALIGANGAGKTTLIKNLLGLLEPTEGTVTVFGRPHDRAVRSRIGYVPQNLGLYTDLTEDENLDFRAAVFGGEVFGGQVFGGEVFGGVERPTRRRAQPVIADVPLGRQRQIAFAAAIGHRPELLILDEPTSGVSPLARSRLWDQIHEQADRGVAVLVSTHYTDEAEQADRLVIMSRGSIVAAGVANDIVGDRTAIEVQAEHWAELFEEMDRRGLAISLNGRRIRVLDRTADEVTDLLGASADSAIVEVVPATLEEVVISLDARRVTRSSVAPR